MTNPPPLEYKTALGKIICNQAEQLIKAPLPTEREQIEKQRQAVGELFNRWLGSPKENSEFPPTIIDLTVRLGELDELARTVKQKAEVVRHYTKSEKFRLNSLERTIAAFESRLATGSNQQVRERLEGCIRITRQELRSILEVKVSERQLVMRRAELQHEYRRIHSQLAITKDDANQKELTSQLNQIHEELARC
jgi:hypothetical protein